MERDKATETQLLERAARHIPDHGHRYVLEILDSLDASEVRLNGNSGWEGKSLRELAEEMLEEAIDIPAWGAGFNYRLDQADIDPVDRERIRLRLLAALAFGAITWRYLHELAEEVEGL